MQKPQRSWPLETTVLCRDHSPGLSPKREEGKGWGEEAEGEERKREREEREEEKRKICGGRGRVKKNKN